MLALAEPLRQVTGEIAAETVKQVQTFNDAWPLLVAIVSAQIVGLLHQLLVPWLTKRKLNGDH